MTVFVTVPLTFAAKSTIINATPNKRSTALQQLATLIDTRILPTVTNNTVHTQLNEHRADNNATPIDIETTDTNWRRLAQDCHECDATDTTEVLLLHDRFITLAQRYGLELNTSP